MMMKGVGGCCEVSQETLKYKSRWWAPALFEKPSIAYFSSTARFFSRWNITVYTPVFEVASTDI